MIFFSKRNNAPGRSSNTEACVSIMGLFLAIGLIGGLGVLIYGLVKGNVSGTIGGGIVFGVSVLLSIILAIVFIYCLKTNDVNSNATDQQSSVNHRQYKQNRHHKQNRQIKREQTTSHEITVISGVPKYDKHPQQQQQQQQQSNGYDIKRISPPDQSNGLADSTNSGYGKQVPPSPSKTSSFVLLNQSNGSNDNQSQQSSINLNPKRGNYNRH